MQKPLVSGALVFFLLFGTAALAAESARPIGMPDSVGNDIQLPAGSLRLQKSVPLVQGSGGGKSVRTFSKGISPSVADPLAVYSNTTLLGTYFVESPCFSGAANSITAIWMDNLNFPTNATVSTSVTGISFSVANANLTMVSATPRFRIWLGDGAPLPSGVNGPGTFVVGFDFGALSFPAFNIQPFSVTIPAGIIPIPTPGGASKMWFGIQFDSAGSTTAATCTELLNLGQALADPVDVGSSTEVVFAGTTAADQNGVANPVGTENTLGGTANAYWELRVAGLPVELQSFEVD